MNLFELAGGAVMEQVQAAAKRVFENIYDPNTEAKKPRKLVIELVFKPNENDRTDVDVSAVVKTTLLPRRAIHTKMIVEADNKGKIMADEYRSAMRGQMELENENEGKVLDPAPRRETGAAQPALQSKVLDLQKRKVE